MSVLKFDKEKYLQLAKSEGPSVALTALQKDIIKWEYQAFEGKEGYQPELWEDLHEVRDFSRELWRLATQS